MVRHSGDGSDNQSDEVADEITHFRSLRGDAPTPVDDIGSDPADVPAAPEGLSLPVASTEPPGAVIGPGGPLAADLPVPPAMQYAAGPPVGANERARAAATDRASSLAAGDEDPDGGAGGVTTTKLWPEAGAGAQGPVAVLAPTNAPSTHTEWVSCPECGEGAMVDPSLRRAEDFCPRCDFPLFWARSSVVPLSGEDTGASLRRLPGTVGRAATASVACPHCGEPNSPTAIVCIRCTQPMVIAPVEYEPLAPEPVYVAPAPEPEPEPERAFPWGWVIAACAAIVIITVVVFWIALS